MAYYEIDNRPEEIRFEGASDMVARTIRNAKNLLMTKMGEVPYDRHRGFDAGLYDLPLSEFRSRLLPELDRMMLWEPDAEVAEAEATLGENGEIYIRVILKIDI